MNPDLLAELEEEQRFLLRSLDDLEREHDAGDVDEADYLTLRDGYTARAAAVLRSVATERAEFPPKPPVEWRRLVVTGAVAVIAIGALWWWLAASSAQRLPGQEITGLDARGDSAVLQAQARSVMFDSPGDAAQIYQQVLDDDPDNVTALAYGGWTLALSALTTEDATEQAVMFERSKDLLLQAIEVDPTYPDPYCFLAIVQYRFVGDAAGAEPLVEACLLADPPADVAGMVEGMRDSIEADLAEQ